MFSTALLIGIYSYLVLAIGLLGLINKTNFFLLSFGFFLFFVYIKRESLRSNVLGIKKELSLINKDKFASFLLFLILLQSCINLIGVFGPELSFDALWYHLAIPKIYMMEKIITYIPGGLLYYSAMPKLTEMLYLASISLSGEILAKLVHFGFGILTSIALYQLSRRYLSVSFSVLSVLLYYGNLVVAWQSTTAYVDLARTFFELMAFSIFLIWIKKGDFKLLFYSGILIGLAISVKLLAILSVGIFFILIFLKNKKMAKSLKDFTYFLIPSVIVPLPWFVFSFVNTNSPIHPVFTKYYDTSFNLSILNPLNFFHSLFEIFLKSSDPISPIYLVLLPIILYLFLAGKLAKYKIIVIYSILGFMIWYFTPRTGGGRFILPYLPIFSLLCLLVVNELKEVRLRLFVIFIIIFVSSVSIPYRFLANEKFITYLEGHQSKKEFLTKNLNFGHGDFYDIDGYFERNIRKEDRVLLYGFHNLYYVDFPFIHESWVKKGDMFTHIATQNSELPERFSFWPIVYYNPETGVKVYTLQEEWVY
ncbi:MAG: glycosyltransferase family 39 protein [Candidatus Levybacteria bacterium]|nr:glycosyltransferase family 39 protein [Candidatus Levybacteria bacterium]